MYSIMKRINQYARDFGIPFKNIYISSTYFPEYFNRIVLKELNGVLPRDKKELYIKEYILTTEGNDELKIMAYASDNKTRVIIFPEDSHFDYRIVGKKLSEYEVIKAAKLLESSELNEIINLLKVKGLSKRVDIRQTSFDRALKLTAELCVGYIDYCNKYYQATIKDKQESEKSSIKFTAPETSTVIRRTRLNHNGSVERVNSLLSVEDRVNVLESHAYLYSGYAYSKNNRDIEFINYLYDIGEGKYALVMEPYNGTSATKVLIIDSTEEISQEYFNLLVKSTLNLPYSVTCKREDIIRFYHSTIDSFEDKLSVVLKGVSKSNSGYYKRIRKMVDDKSGVSGQ